MVVVFVYVVNVDLLVSVVVNVVVSWCVCNCGICFVLIVFLLGFWVIFEVICIILRV